MKLIIFTTDTPHHIYFVKNISKYFNIKATILEKKLSSPPTFSTHHSFEDLRHEYENSILLEGEKQWFNDYCQTFEFDNINDTACVHFIEKEKPDVILTFGTGIIKKPIIDKCREGIVNFHGGDPQFYRGLDSHLWAIYHKDFSQFKVSLHRLNTHLDDGELIDQRSVEITKDLELYMLRSETTKLCIELAISALDKFAKMGVFRFVPQKSIGRYYSFMPSVLKEICLKNYNNYKKRL